MRPHVTCHIMSSVDGRIKSAHWPIKNAAKLFEKFAAKIPADAWLVGRTTMQEFCSSAQPRRRGRFKVPAGDFIGDAAAQRFAIVIDPSGKCRWDANHVESDHVIEVLTSSVSGEYLDHLRAQRVSYVFGGKRKLNLARVLDKLGRLFPIRRVRIDGGGGVNGSFLSAGLVDELSHVIVPVADGTMHAPSIFDVADGLPRANKALRLMAVKRQPAGVLWCRYKLR